MRIGYARVSTQDQNTDAQVDALERAQCDKIYVEKASGTLDRRPELDRMLDQLRRDDVVVVAKLDRLGRSMKHLVTLAGELEDRGVHLVILDQGIDTSTPVGKMFFHILAAIAEFERALIVERTLAGIEAARARGRKGGRRPKMTPVKIKEARRMYDSKEYTVQQIADTLGVGRATIYRTLDKEA